MKITKEVKELKELILNPGPTDRSGYSALDLRALANKKLKTESHKKEEEIAISLLNHVSDFKSPDISRLITYIKESGFSEEVIFNRSLKFIKEKNKELSLLQRFELIRFLLQLNAAKVSVDFVQDSLAPMKNDNPWLYAEILSEKAPYKGLEFVSYLIKSGNSERSQLTHWITSMMKSDDLALLRNVGQTISILEPDKQIQALITHYMRKKDIVIAPLKAYHINIQDTNPGTFSIADSKEFNNFLKKVQNKQKYLNDHQNATPQLAHAE